MLKLFEKLFKSPDFEKPIKILDKIFTNIDQIDAVWYKNRYKIHAEKTNGAVFLEGDFIFIPIYKLENGKRVYAGFETCVGKDDWELAETIRKENTLEGLKWKE